jgi:germacradienol/geosmin synthase
MVGGGGVWGREEFEERGYGRFAAYVHPDADEAVLELITLWFVWLWFVDDALGEVGDKGRFLRRLAHRPDGGAPENPAERGIDDLWARTTPMVPEAWLRRFRCHVAELLDEMRVSEANNRELRVPNPVEYIDARRGFGGMLFAADLVEPGSDAHLPDDVVGSRPLRQLRETFADAVALRNDLLSYRKEVVAGEGPSNGVAVLQHFLGCDPVTAARLVDDLRRARLEQFDHVAGHELPAYLDDHDIDAPTRAAVARWVTGLRDWMAGDTRWAEESGRYSAPASPLEAALAAAIPRGPTGLGTAAARIGASST